MYRYKDTVSFLKYVCLGNWECLEIELMVGSFWIIPHTFVDQCKNTGTLNSKNILLDHNRYLRKRKLQRSCPTSSFKPKSPDMSHVTIQSRCLSNKPNFRGPTFNHERFKFNFYFDHDGHRKDPYVPLRQSPTSAVQLL